MGGKVICVVGAPRTGKSYLVRKLAEHYAGTAFYEGEESDFPERIKEDIAKRIRPLERALWFRNRLVAQYRQALDIKHAGGVAVIDIAYFAVELYIDVLTDDPFEREILHDLARSDISLFGVPDKIIHLTSSEARMKEFLREGGREFDSGEHYYTEHIVPIEHAWKTYLVAHVEPRLVVDVDRSSVDFDVPEDFHSLLSKLT